jgi:hypothetical protein
MPRTAVLPLFPGYLLCREDIETWVVQREALVIKTASAASTLVMVVGAASLLFAGYVFLTSLPDLRRYIRISTM